MTRSARDEALAYVAAHNVMTLATDGPEGLWAAALFYVNDGFTFWFLSAPTTRHSRNIAAKPAVAGTIQEDYDDWRDIRGIQFEGLAARIDGKARRDAIARYREKFPVIGAAAGASLQIARALGKVDWYVVESDRVFYIDNSLGLGHRDEIDVG